MQYVKILGLAALAALASMAFIGVSSAWAGNTTLCKVNELPCAEANQVKHFHMESVGALELLGLFGATFLCLESLALAEAESASLANPLLVRLTGLTLLNCGTNAEHNNCTVTTLGSPLTTPLFKVLKTSAGVGEATATSGSILMSCTSGLHCVFGGNAINVGPFAVESALHTVGAGHSMLTAEGVAMPRKETLFACPAGEARWHALYEPLEHLWISS